MANDEAGSRHVPRGITARQILGRWPVWVFPSVLVTLVSFLLALVYCGGIADPQGSVRHLPIGLVDEDTGPIGARFVHGIATAPDPHDRVSWQVLDPAAAKDRFGSGRIYGAVVVPAGFTTALTAIVSPGSAPANVRRPYVTLLTNPGAGSFASSLATAAELRAVKAGSAALGARLAPQVRAPTVAQRMLLADPVTTATAVGHPIGSRTGLGLTAFYFSLIVVLTGFLGANIVSSGVDAALGYAPSELGPLRRMRAPVRITRTQTLVVKSVMSVVLSLLTTSVVVFATAVVVRLDLPHLFHLWVFAACASAVVGLGAQAILAVFGGLGQIVSMFFFVALAIPSAGATIPLEAVPGFYRGLAWFEPLRPITEGVRAIMYFDARADAGLARAWLMLCVGLVVSLLFGFGVARFYDRRGLHRARPPA